MSNKNYNFFCDIFFILCVYIHMFVAVSASLF